MKTKGDPHDQDDQVTRIEKSPAMPFYGKDAYDDETFSLASFGTQGFYLFLAWWQWGEGSIPADVEVILDKIPRRKVAEAQKLWPKVEALFPVMTNDASRRQNASVERRRAALVKKRGKHREGADLTNAKRWGSDSLDDSLSDSLSDGYSDSLRAATATATATATAMGSAKEMVETFELQPQHRIWAQENAASVPVDEEFADWKNRMRGNGYKTNQGPVKDAQAAFYTALRNAEKWGTYRKANGKRDQQHGSAAKPRPSAKDFGMRTIDDVLPSKRKV